jgi:peptidoglycan/xylan/chitin deacetylase (PgdA/CDA1 family)
MGTWFMPAASLLALVVSALLPASPHLATTANGGLAEGDPQETRPRVVASILVYHRFGSVVADQMTVRTATLRSQLQFLKAGGYPVVPLRAVVAFLRGEGPPPPPRAVVITVDDGHRSVATAMLPLVREYSVPVTLFVYPSASSNASYAMTWEQLAALKRTGLFDIQSHTYWHPNFVVEKRREAYRQFAVTQLIRSRTVITQKVGDSVDLLAWPFGVYDEELLALATECGYVAGVTLQRRRVTTTDSVMALPRFLVTDATAGRAFEALLPRDLP